MPRVDERHRRGIAATAVLGIAATTAYLDASSRAVDGARGSSATGLAFGIAAASIMVFDAALSLRRRVPTWAIGRAETWLKGHIWLGLLTVPLVLFHGGFRVGGALTTALMIVFFLMIASGVVGLLLQHNMPKLMTSELTRETVYEQIEHVIDRLRIEAYDIAASVCGRDVLPPKAWEREQSERVRQDYRQTRRRGKVRQPAERALPGSEPVRALFDEVRRFLVSDGRTGLLSSAESAAAVLESVGRRMPGGAAALHEAAIELADAADQRRLLRRQERLHLWLHAWLLVHVPLTLALFALLGAHIWWALRYSSVF